MRALVIVSLLLFSSLILPHVAIAQERTTPEHVIDCDEERFIEPGGPFGVVTFRPGVKPSMILSADECLYGDIGKCSAAAIDTKHRWLAGKKIGDWVCISDARISGWTRLADVEIGDEPITHYDDWLGKWERDAGGADLTITKGAHGTVAVTGSAEWMSGPDATPHLGDIDDSGKVDGVTLLLGMAKCLGTQWDDEDCYDCSARLVVLNGRVLVVDNGNCGGMNVRFNGIYDRVKPKKQK